MQELIGRASQGSRERSGVGEVAMIRIRMFAAEQRRTSSSRGCYSTSKPGRYRISEGVRDEASGLAGFAVVGATAGPGIH